MVSICFYFQLHQPYRLNKYTVFDIGNSTNYFDCVKNKDILKKVAEKCYIPANKIIENIIKKYPEFKVSYSFSGILLEQLNMHAPEVIDSFRSLISTGNVEILSETYYHSLAYLYSKEEFIEQIRMHREKIKNMFNYSPKVFRNTELIYNNELARIIENLGYKAILLEGADRILGMRSPNFIYKPKGTNRIKMLLKNYRLSDDIAFRFSSRNWKEFPLTAEKYAHWISTINGNGDIVNLFMDYETFGEHQWESTGIFKFLEKLPGEILKHPDNNFVTPSEAADIYPAVAELDIPYTISWADIERDLSAWLGNKMQQSAIQKIYEIENQLKKPENQHLLETWRKLQCSDHFYYMCTKWFNDGDVHKYFNPYDSPYDAFIAFMNVLADLKQRVK